MEPSGDTREARRGGGVTTAPHRSIGEVLALLKDEFPDITISKIRFLESQGLLDPERTPSGYRRFYDKDVDRLRWILRQQRENFLPLKVIKGRLAEGLDVPADEEPAHAAPPQPAADTRPTPPARAPQPAVAPASMPAQPAPDAPRRVLPEPALFAQRPIMPTYRGGDSAVSLTVDELAASCGLSVADIADLERFDLIEHRSIGATIVYDEEALLVARLAAAFLSHGVEARHLRMYKVAADREAGVCEQVVSPIIRQRNPDARRHAIDTIADLTRLGEGLHAAMLRRALKSLHG
jgi:DNA-binding transcriptional MerR regulator